MFVLCPHCHFLVGIDPRTGAPPPNCPKCGGVVVEPLPPAADEAAIPAAQALDPFAPVALPPLAPAAAAQAEADAVAEEAAVPEVAAVPEKPPRKPRARTRRANGEGATGVAAAEADAAPSVPVDGAPAPTAPVEAATAIEAPAPDAAPAPIEATAPVAAPAPIEAPARVEAPTSIEAAAPVEAAAPIAPTAAFETTAPIESPVPVATPFGDDGAAHDATATVPVDEDAIRADPAARPAVPAHPPRARPAPSFVESRPAPRRRGWRAPVAALGLAVLLAAQLLLAQRATLAADARWRPVLQPLCAALRCTLPPWREPTAFTMLSRDVRPHPSQPGTLLIHASFRNDARWPQPWPRLLLTLSDLDGRMVGARAFEAGEYLGARPAQAELAPGQTAAVVLAVVEPAPNVVAFTFDFR